MIKAVIFDLDGTLANTADLATGSRMPWHVINPGFAGARDWRWNEDVSNLPGVLISRGYRVVIATRAPLAYASTLAHLLGIDTMEIRASCGHGLAKAETIATWLRAASLEQSEVLYVGDIEDDTSIATAAGVNFAHVKDVVNGSLANRLGPIRWPGIPREKMQSPIDSSPSVSPRFLNAIADSADGGASAQLVAESIRNGIPDAELHFKALDRMFQYPELATSDRAALCFFTLVQDRGTPLRRTLQHGAFAGLKSSNAQCILDLGLFQCFRSLVTKYELRTDNDLRRRFLKGVKAVFPHTTGTLVVDSFKIDVRVARTYGVDVGGRLRTTKDYGGRYGTRFRSGSNVQLGDLDLEAAILASTLDTDDLTPVVSIPSAPATHAQPGEVSLRLAHLVANMTGRKVVQALLRNGDEFRINANLAPCQVIVIDDQVTTGASLSRGIHSLLEAGYHVRTASTFSGSPRFLQQIGAPAHRDESVCGFADVARWVGFPCPCGRKV